MRLDVYSIEKVAAMSLTLASVLIDLGAVTHGIRASEAVARGQIPEAALLTGQTLLLTISATALLGGALTQGYLSQCSETEN